LPLRPLFQFDLPVDWTVLPYDNIVTVSQVIPTVEPVEVASIHLLVAGDGTDGEGAHSN
jgi:3-dehydroquinate synthase class II